jgi:hypothetical protein
MKSNLVGGEGNNTTRRRTSPPTTPTHVFQDANHEISATCQVKNDFKLKQMLITDQYR